MRFWWVNHKQTFNAEVGGQYIWCPKSPVADPESLPRMGVALDRRLFTGPFNPEQRRFLEYHRKEIFLKSAA